MQVGKSSVRLLGTYCKRGSSNADVNGFLLFFSGANGHRRKQDRSKIGIETHRGRRKQTRRGAVLLAVGQERSIAESKKRKFGNSLLFSVWCRRSSRIGGLLCGTKPVWTRWGQAHCSTTRQRIEIHSLTSTSLQPQPRSNIAVLWLVLLVVANAVRTIRSDGTPLSRPR